MVRRSRGGRSVEYLYSDYDLYAVRENTREKMVQTIDSADASIISGRDPQEVADEFVAQFRLDTPVLTEGAIGVDVEEAEAATVLRPWKSRDILRPVHWRCRRVARRSDSPSGCGSAGHCTGPSDAGVATRASDADV
jgi:hypothetical protein